MYMNVSQPDPRIREKEVAEREIEVTRKLTDALFEYLSFSPRTDIENLESQSTPPKTCFTTESLIDAVKHRDATQSQLDQYEEIIQNTNMPKGIMEIATMAFMAPLKAQLEQQNEWVSRIQKELEDNE